MMFSCKITPQAVLNLKSKSHLLKRLLSSQSVATANSYESAMDYESIPRPSVFSFVRDFMMGGKFNEAPFHDYVLEMHRRYGDIFVMPGVFGNSDVVMVLNTKDIETVFRNEGIWPTRMLFESVKHFREEIKKDFFGGTVGLIVSQGEQWGKMRSAINPVLMKPQNLTMYIKPFEEINDEFIDRIKTIRDSKTLEVSDDFENEVNRFVFESISMVALNRKLGLISNPQGNTDAEDLLKLNRLFFYYAFKLDLQPSMWKIIRTPNYYKSMRVQEELFRITQNYVNKTLEDIAEKQKKGGNNQEMYSILEKLLLIDEKLAVVTAMDMIGAGADPISVTIFAILLCLAKNPDKQNKLRDEILKILPTKETKLNENNMKSLPYLRAVIKEGIRYYPNGTGSIRSPTHDVVLSGYKVPKGTTVAVNHICLLKNEKFFSQADKFIPERWLRGGDNKKDKFDPFSYLPFGIGARICVGKRLAELQIEVALLKLLRNFEVEFNYDASKPFKGNFLNTPRIPMKFTFKDI